MLTNSKAQTLNEFVFEFRTQTICCLFITHPISRRVSQESSGISNMTQRCPKRYPKHAVSQKCSYNGTLLPGSSRSVPPRVFLFITFPFLTVSLPLVHHIVFLVRPGLAQSYPSRPVTSPIVPSQISIGTPPFPLAFLLFRYHAASEAPNNLKHGALAIIRSCIPFPPSHVSCLPLPSRRFHSNPL